MKVYNSPLKLHIMRYGIVEIMVFLGCPPQTHDSYVSDLLKFKGPL